MKRLDNDNSIQIIRSFYSKSYQKKKQKITFIQSNKYINCAQNL